MKVAIAGLGRMGQVHARNLLELSRETGQYQLGALVDHDPARLKQFTAENGCADVAQFATVEELANSGVCEATFIVTPTEKHREHATRLLRAGHRVLLEKPLTGTLEGDREFAALLDREYPTALMLAFQRRYDPALQYARELVRSGAIGRVFKIYSSLEDSGPPPQGYQSDGILPDMSIHNVDEILWLTGEMPLTALAVGSRVFEYRVSPCNEDFDDALLYLWFKDDLIAQVQVTRNHVSGYRVETNIYGEEGQIQIGHFAQQPDVITVQAYGRRLDSKTFPPRQFAGREDKADRPEFVARFADAYKAELADFLQHCLANKPFPVTHRDGLRAQEVIAAGSARMLTKELANPVRAVATSA